MENHIKARQISEDIYLMKHQDEVETKLKELKPTLSEKFHVGRTGYFGPYSTGEQTEHLDMT